MGLVYWILHESHKNQLYMDPMGMLDPNFQKHPIQEYIYIFVDIYIYILIKSFLFWGHMEKNQPTFQVCHVHSLLPSWSQ